MLCRKVRICSDGLQAVIRARSLAPMWIDVILSVDRRAGREQIQILSQRIVRIGAFSGKDLGVLRVRRNLQDLFVRQGEEIPCGGRSVVNTSLCGSIHLV